MRRIAQQRELQYAIIVALAAAAPLALLGAAGVWWPALFLSAPLIALYCLARVCERDERERLKLLTALSGLLQAAHPQMEGHLHRVAEHGRRAALLLGMPERRAQLVYCAALLHDVGKIGVDERVLNKPGPLTDAEYRHVQRHAEIGAKVMEAAEPLLPMAEWVRHHHERLDGKGYPAGLAGDRIPLESRIIAVVDAYDAMVGGPGDGETRRYRPRKSPQQAMAELRRCAGTQFDPRVVEQFCTLVREETEA
ncbi:MAG: HD-GYP domain-containing protein [Armatimonadetes bacterium]|nr:HD-GYP domain-containing protein [Armatimonadota bacterium]